MSIPFLDNNQIFEGLADVVKLPDGSRAKYVPMNDDEEGRYCLVCGTQDGRIAIAIGLWDEDRQCFSALAKMKDGSSLPPPFKVKGAKAELQKLSLSSLTSKVLAKLEKQHAFNMLRILSSQDSLKHTITLYNKYAAQNK